jgi:hypothetical protein
MFDPNTMAATASAGKEVVSGAVSAGKEIAKRADSYIALLLKPAFKTAGKEIDKLLKERIAEWKAERQEQNLFGHAKRVYAFMEKRTDSNTELPPLRKETVEDPKIFEAWVDGAQDVDPDEPTLGAIWQRLLIDIADGKTVEAVLIEKLKLLSSMEAKELLLFKKRDIRTENSPEKVFTLDNLCAKGLVQRNYHHIRNTAAICSLFASWGGLVVFYSTGKTGLIAQMSEPRVITQIGVIYLMLSLFLLTFQLKRRRWEIQWIGKKLLGYAKAL